LHRKHARALTFENFCQGINLPGTPVTLPAITEKDKADLIFGVQQGVDLIAASFVRRADDVKEIRKVLGLPGRNIMIFSKIESEEGVENFDEILAVCRVVLVCMCVCVCVCVYDFLAVCPIVLLFSGA
jgi:pyruvate kinase